MNNFLYILLLLTFSCLPRPQAKLDHFNAKIYVNWFTTFKLEFSPRIIINNGTALTHPKSTWQYILRVTFLSDNGKSSKTQCLFYKVPHLATKTLTNGELRIVTIKEKGTCKEQFTKNIDSKLSQISDLKIFYHDQTTTRPLENITFEAKTIYLNYNLEKKNHWSIFPLMNMPSKTVSLKKFTSLNRPRKTPGSIYLPLNEKIQRSNKNRYIKPTLGSFNDSYKNQTAKKCHEVDKQCKNLINFKCNLCLHGWFETVSFNCPQGGTKFCGVNRCGERGQPACLRGLLASKQKGRQVCLKNSRAGFCNNDLHTYCDENNILICL